MKVNYSGRTSCGCPYINEPDPAKHWKECHYRLNSEKRAAFSTQSELLEALEALSKSAPSACCSDFNHKAGDFHEHDEACPPLDRYEAACLAARAAIAKAKGENA